MATDPNIRVSLGILGEFTYAPSVELGRAAHRAGIGQNGFPTVEQLFNLPAVLGDMSDQVDWVVSGKGTIDSETDAVIDLSDARFDRFELPVAAAVVKFVIIALINPGTGKKLTLRPFGDTLGGFAFGLGEVGAGSLVCKDFAHQFTDWSRDGFARIDGDETNAHVLLKNETLIDGIEFAYMIGGMRAP